MGTPDDLTIVTWKWRGWRDVYDARHVNRLGKMLERTMSGRYRFVCITDDPEGIEYETYPLWSIPAPEGVAEGAPNCYVRLKMFDPAMSSVFGSKILSLDLDCVIFKDLRPLLTSDTFKAARGHSSVVNGSMWQLRLGSHPEVWADYDPVGTPKRVAQTLFHGRPISGSDQAWLSIKMPNAQRWTEEDGIYQFMELRPQNKVPKHARAVFFAGPTKPWDPLCKMMNRRLYTPL